VGKIVVTAVTAASKNKIAAVAFWQRNIAVSERQIAQQRRRAEETLAAATKTANSLVFDLAQRFRNSVGIPADLIKDILDRARDLQEQLLKSGQVTPGLKRSEEALMEIQNALLAIGDTAGALAAYMKAVHYDARKLQGLLGSQQMTSYGDGIGNTLAWIASPTATHS
jgi:hypothetical protein